MRRSLEHHGIMSLGKGGSLVLPTERSVCYSAQGSCPPVPLLMGAPALHERQDRDCEDPSN
jgi:hypothetical protein